MYSASTSPMSSTFFGQYTNLVTVVDTISRCFILEKLFSTRLLKEATLSAHVFASAPIICLTSLQGSLFL